MKCSNLLDSFNNAIKGIIETARTERNMKIHLCASVLVLIACFFFNISKIEVLIVGICIVMVLATELINTAIEAAIDMTTNYYHPLAKVAKNAAAGGVFVTATGALICGYIIFWDKLATLSYSLIHRAKNSEPYAILIALVLVCFLTVIIKAFFGEGTPLKGGMPSGHSAISFSIATAISFITESQTCIILSFIMAFITAQSRVDSKVHSIWEVIVGAVFGVLITMLIFSLFKI